MVDLELPYLSMKFLLPNTKNLDPCSKQLEEMFTIDFSWIKQFSVFKATGSLVTPATFGSKTAEYVVIGGGGGGANDMVFGGAGMELKEGTHLYHQTQHIPITVGAAGAADGNGGESFIGPPGSKSSIISRWTLEESGGTRDGELAGGSGGGARGNRPGASGGNGTVG